MSTANGEPHMPSMALMYAGAGICVFPVSDTKAPLTPKGTPERPGGFHYATTEREQVERWWAQWPNAGIGTPDFDAVDVDTYKPECAPTWKRIRPLIPKGTPQNRTARGGLQFIFKAGTLADNGPIGPGVDKRYAWRNYIILPPSSALGGRYEAVVSVMTRKPRPAPDFGTTDAGSDFGQLLLKMDDGEKILEERNKAAWWRAVEVLRTLPPHTDLAPVRELVQSWVNANCEGDLDEVDVPKQVRGAERFVANERAGGRSRSSSAAPRELTSTPFSRIEKRSIRWWEKPLWQRSAFELFVGAKGAGKGTYTAGFGARLTRAGFSVLFISSEDSAEIDLAPRLEAAGADMERAHVVQQHVKLPEDVPALLALAGALEDIALIVIDPVANHIGDRNSNSDAEVRDAIAPLNRLADELDCLVIGVRHPSKDRSRGAVASVLGSTAWVDTPRAVVMVVVDDEQEDVRHIQVVAGNRSRNGRALSFRIEEARVEGLEEPVTVAVELGESAKSVDALVSAGAGNRSSRSADARELILDILEEDGEQESDAFDARVARDSGLTAKTVRNVRGELKNEGLVKAFPEKDESGVILRWLIARTQAPRT